MTTLLGSRRNVDHFMGTGAGIGPHIFSAHVPRVRWNPDAVKRLSGDVEWAHKSNPTGPAEVAGLLVGRMGPVNEILDCEPVFLIPEHEYAAEFTRAGKSQFQRALAAIEATVETDRAVIG